MTQQAQMSQNTNAEKVVPIPGIQGWDEIQGDPSVWHVRFMQVRSLPEKLVAGRRADYLGYFFTFGRFTPSDVAHYVRAYATPAQLHAAFEMYRAFPANAQFNAAQREPNDVPLFFAAGDRSPFAKLAPKIAEGLRANGCTHVETGVIRGSVHYVVEDQPEAVADFVEQICITAFEMRAGTGDRGELEALLSRRLETDRVCCRGAVPT